jgi:hypothetical protein
MALPTPRYRNTNPPAWFVIVRDNQQAQMDNQYLHGPTGNSVDSYSIAAAAWIEDQSRKRENSPDPEKYTPEPFMRPVPQREIWDITEEGTMYT